MRSTPPGEGSPDRDRSHVKEARDLEGSTSEKDQNQDNVYACQP